MLTTVFLSRYGRNIVEAEPVSYTDTQNIYRYTESDGAFFRKYTPRLNRLY
jgi:hypothetical protein